jgi:hypothetical protein
MAVFFSVEMQSAYGRNHVFRVMRLHNSGREEQIGSLCLVSEFPQAKGITNFKYPREKPTNLSTCAIENEKKPFLFWRREESNMWKAWRKPTDAELSELTDRILDDNPFLDARFFESLLPKE